MYNVYYNSVSYFQVESREEATALKRRFLEERDPKGRYTHKYKQGRYFLYVGVFEGWMYRGSFNAVRTDKGKTPGLRLSREEILGDRV